MGKRYEQIDPRLRGFLEHQQMFFVATAPVDPGGHVNLSPKGLDTFRILSPTEVAYLDYVGSGAETIAHLHDNGRITLMFCAFEGAPTIVRLYGRGRTVGPDDPEFARLRGLFPPAPPARAIIVVSVQRIADSCGFGVPRYRFEQHRTQLIDWSARKGPGGLQDYQREKNAASIDGLPAVTWLRPDPDAPSTGAS